MTDLTIFPHLLAALNMTTAVLLATGYVFIRRGDKLSHRKCMLAAISVAVVFMAVYIYYHANAGLAKFGGEGVIRTVYFTILIAHVSIAVTIPVLAPWTAFRALKGRFAKHRKMARWTLPLWLYVSASGVVVYVMSIHLFPDTGIAM